LKISPEKSIIFVKLPEKIEIFHPYPRPPAFKPD